jgi:hypothetical protein
MGLVLAKSAKTNGLSEPANFGRHIREGPENFSLT